MGDRLPWERPLGAVPGPDGTTTFRVWAPRAREVTVELAGRSLALDADDGVFEGRAETAPGDDYRYRPDGGAPLPDPCSRNQPDGVRGPSRVVDPGAVAWDEGGWAGLDRRGLVLYELHVGTFTREGTFAAAAARLPALAELGVTAIELMPVTTFPGRRNWGYDGLYAWAPHHAYGGPDGLAALVAAAHRAGLGVILDVVYNHLGPGAEALEAFGPYHTDRYGTPWGAAMNFDDRDAGGVREWAIQNACMWLTEYRVDGLRLDAVHAIHDGSARHVLAELCARAEAAAPRPPLLIAESDLNDPKVIRPRKLGGWGFAAQWADDFHHALHALLTGERDGYYADFGEVRHLAEATRRPFVYHGGYSAFRRRRHGAPAEDRPPRQFVVYSQNHDQVGNRALGDRLPREARPLAALWTLMSPFVPMLFMGEEYGEDAPFQFFTDHIDPFIADATRVGRRREFAAFVGFDEEVPDPQDPATHRRSLLDQSTPDEGLRDLYRRLLALRSEIPQEVAGVQWNPERRYIVMYRRGAVAVAGNFSGEPADVPVHDVEEIVLATAPEAALERPRLRLPPLAGAVLR
jgi:maltooligosyltrehalose trehalohydrolase